MATKRTPETTKPPTTAFERIMAGLLDAVAYARGETTGARVYYPKPERPDA